MLFRSVGVKLEIQTMEYASFLSAMTSQTQAPGSLWLAAIDPNYFASVRTAVATRPHCALPTARAAVAIPRGSTVTAPGSSPVGTRTTAPGATASGDAGVVIRLDPPTSAAASQTVTAPPAPSLEHLVLTSAIPSTATQPFDVAVAPKRVAVRLTMPVTSVTA